MPREMSIRPATALNVALAALAVVALLLIAIRSEDAPGIEVTRRDPPGQVDTIVVTVEGAVARPGVYAVAPGDRISDVVEAAGGLDDDADIGAVNLALRLRDEDRIVIPARTAGASAATALVDLNAATQAQLEGLPGIGPVRAAAIIAARPFDDVDELIEREVIPAGVFEDIRTLVTIR